MSNLVWICCLLGSFNLSRLSNPVQTRFVSFDHSNNVWLSTYIVLTGGMMTMTAIFYLALSMTWNVDKSFCSPNYLRESLGLIVQGDAKCFPNPFKKSQHHRDDFRRRKRRRKLSLSMRETTQTKLTKEILMNHFLWLWNSDEWCVTKTPSCWKDVKTIIQRNRKVMMGT